VVQEEEPWRLHTCKVNTSTQSAHYFVQNEKQSAISLHPALRNGHIVQRYREFSV